MQRINFEISDDTLRELTEAMNRIALKPENLPNTAAQFNRSVNYAKNRISDYLHGMGDLDGVDSLDKPLKNVKVEHDGGDFDVKITAAASGLDKVIAGQQEHEFDMKTKYPYGKKSRITQSGKNKGLPYLIIPFRWGTPNDKGTKRRWNNFIPQHEYNSFVKGMNVSQTNPLKNYLEANFKNEPIERAGYDWAKENGRVTKELAWNDYSLGMVRMKDGAKANYFTFRIISAASPKDSWIRHYKGIPPIDIESAWARTVKQHCEQMIEEGFKADMGIN